MNRHNDTRKPAVMKEELLYSIIDQLHTMDYRGTIVLFSNNEPLLDGRIFKFIEYARKQLPNARHKICTNGTLLNVEKFLNLVKNLDKIIVDNYDDNFQLTPPIEKTLIDFQALPPQTYADSPCEVIISMRKKNQKLLTRGGAAPNRINEPNKFRPTAPCIYPFVYMEVRPDGTISPCCQLPMGTINLGDLNKQSLREIWRGQVYQDFCKEMYFNGRQSFSDCEFCDDFCLEEYYVTSFADERNRLATEIKIGRNLHGKCYMFDTMPFAKNFFDQMKSRNAELNGFIDVRGGGADAQDDCKCVTFEQAIGERAFIVFPSPNYNDEIFDIVHGAGYQYAKDYLIFPAEL